MRIQHNITAMNSYRNYTANTRSVAKNLEKLSSGYKINRAGDDAAGLAISEKMRAQITGLKTAQKNAKDGISLVQTAEGALTEVHSMLNRMVELADQSANGTYDNETDRTNLQKEVTQLKSEINRIADASNFNGIKLLDGSLAGNGATTGGVDGTAAAYVGGAGALTDNAAVAGVYESKVDFGADGLANAIATADNTTGGIVKMALTADDGSTFELNFMVGPGNITATALSGAIKSQLEASTAEFQAINPDWAKFSEKFTIAVDNTAVAASGDSTITFTSKTAGAGQPKITGSTLTFHLSQADGDYATAATTTGSFGAGGIVGTTSTKTSATDAYKSVNFTDGNAALDGKTVTIGNKTYQFAKADEMDKVASGNLAVVLGEDKASTMTNLVSRLKANGVTTASVYNTGSDTVVRIGNTDEIKVSNKQAVTASSASKGVTLGNDTAVNAKYTISANTPAAEDQKLIFNYTDKDGKAQTYTLSMAAADIAAATDNTKSANTLATIINNDSTLKELFTATDDGAGKLTLEAKSDKNGVTLTSLFGAAKDATGHNFVGNTDAGDTVAITAVNGTTAYGAGQTIKLDNNSIKSGDTLEVNGKTYQFLNEGDLSKLQNGATAVVIGTDSAATTKNLSVALKNAGITTKSPATDKLLIENDMTVSVSGGLKLQIGDTADSFNQLTVSVGDMHVKSLGIDEVDISNQTGASTAIEKLKSAINSVSSTRGDLGATQNRLEHTINNLSVMHENIQDAESSIRDVDVADEMMAYTKNNILVQSAQAMLAQANQLPQGVLQLLG